MNPGRDDMVAREEIFDGTMQQLFVFVAGELASVKDRSVGEILASLPTSYFELFLLYQHHNRATIGVVKESDSALGAVSAYLDWRQKLQLQFNPLQADEVLGGDISALEMYHLMPECALGHDKSGQPVVYFLYSRRQPDEVNNMAKIAHRVTTKHIFDYHLWQNEALVELCYFRSRAENKVISSCTLVLDLALLTTENASAEFLHIASRRADLFKQHFPYLVNKILVVNANEADPRLIRKIRDLCSTISPSAAVYISNLTKSAGDLLSKHIDTSELPAEYGGSHQFSLASLPHPFWETEQLRGDQSVSGAETPLLGLRLGLPASSALSLPPPSTNINNNNNNNNNNNQGIKSGSSAVFSTTTTSQLQSPSPRTASSPPVARSSLLQQHVSEEDSLYAPQSFTTSYLASVDSHSSRTFSSSSSKVPSTYLSRSRSVGGGGLPAPAPPRPDDVLTAIPMTPNARVALTAFVELFASNDIPITPANMQSCSTGAEEFGGDPVDDEQLDGENVVLTTLLDPALFSAMRDGASTMSVGCDMSTSLDDASRNITTSFLDTVAIKTSSGVAILQKRQGDRRRLAVSGVGMPPSSSASSLSSSSSAESPVLPFCCRKYQGSFALASGRVYVLSRGVSLSGWLQKWPMKSQGLGGATHRYFVLNSHSLRYWKAAPSSVTTASSATLDSSVSGHGASSESDEDEDGSGAGQLCAPPAELEPCKGQITLTHQTMLRRAKTLFGTSTIEIKSTDDVLTVCASSAAEDEAWFSELHNAVEKLKKAHRDLSVGSERNFPELTWRSPEPACVALDVDVFDPATVEDRERSFRVQGAQQHSGGAKAREAAPFTGTYAVLCRVKNELSTAHSVQIGPNHHISIRLENSDLDSGVQLSSVRLCGDCLVVSGSHGFVGSGRIPALQTAGLVGEAGGSGSLSGDGAVASPAPCQRIYVRRMVNCFHAEDAHVTCLAIPRLLVVSKAKPASPLLSRGGSGTSQQPSNANILASGDEIGGVCVWRREEGGRGVLHYPSYDGQQSRHKHRAGYSWQCVHRARIGHKVTALSFSPCGRVLAATTPERALLFDISQLLVDATHAQDMRTAADDLFAIRSVVLDDLVGCTFSNCILSYGVDLSSPGLVKLWKISSSGSDGRLRGDKVQFMESKLEPLFDRLRDVKDVKPLRILFPNALAAQTSNSGKHSSCRKIMSLSQDESDPDNGAAGSGAVERDGGESDAPVTRPVAGSLPTPTSIVPAEGSYISNHERDSAVLDGYSVDPFYYSDLCVIDPVRMHLRDWWCDYSSRYLLLGHARLSSLSTFESSSSASSPLSGHASSALSSLRSLHDEQDEGPSAGLEAGRGLDRQSTTMFWSTLTNSLGRRIICRYYVPSGYYQRLRNCRESGGQVSSGRGSARSIAPVLEDCLRFCLSLARCFYECLGDEYTHALLVSWKAAALDAAREVLERKSHTIFKDVTIFEEVLKRLELSPDLALSSLNDLVAVMQNIKQWQAEQPRHATLSPSSSSTSPSSNEQKHSPHPSLTSPLTSPLTSLYVESFFRSLRDSLSVVYDEQGLQSVVPAGRMVYLLNGGVPPLGSAHFQQVVEDYMAALLLLDAHSGVSSVLHLLQSLIIDPLNHFERTEPFAVALCVVGLQGVPAYVNDVINTQAADPVGAATVSSPPVQSAGQQGQGQDSPHRQADAFAVHKDISIESLISRVAKDTPPWIRFVLTSDTDKVLHH